MQWQIVVRIEMALSSNATRTIERRTACSLERVPQMTQEAVTAMLRANLWHGWQGTRECLGITVEIIPPIPTLPLGWSSPPECAPGASKTTQPGPDGQRR